jgi:hypothetical protein
LASLVATRSPHRWHRLAKPDRPAFSDLQSSAAPLFSLGIVVSALEVTVEALIYSLRERGVKALDEISTKRRLSELSDQQVIEVGDRLQKLKPEIARAWSPEEVKALLQARASK